MPGIIIDSEEKKTNHFLGVFSHLGIIYILILGIGLGVIYYQRVYQDNNLYVYIPFTYVWPLALIAVGLSMFRVKGLVSLGVGIVLLILALTITKFSISIRADAIESNTQTISSSIDGIRRINTDMSFTATDIFIKGGGSIDGKYKSNYAILTNAIATDKDSIQNISLKQLDIKPGFGSYTKKVDLILPNNIPTLFNITANISPLSLDLKGVLLKSANIKLKGSEASINIDQIETTSTLNITATTSQVNITIPRNIKVILSTSHSFTTNNFTGLIQKDVDSSIYESSNYVASNLEEDKTLAVNLNSTFSQIKVIQQ